MNQFKQILNLQININIYQRKAKQEKCALLKNRVYKEKFQNSYIQSVYFPISVSDSDRKTTTEEQIYR